MWQALLDGLSIFIEKWPLAVGGLIVTCLGWGLSYLLSRGTSEENKISAQSLVLLTFFVAVSLILRLAFLTETFVPPYFDSVEHYRLVKELVTALDSSTLLKTIPSLTPTYYHVGFHFLAALLTLGLHADPMNVILVLGQVILATIPLPLFFLIRHATKSDAAAFFGMLLAGFGWYMPGFAVNWGKYPALGGLLALEIALGIAYFTSQNKAARNRTVAIIWLLLGIIISTLFHSRMLIVIAISLASWIVAGKIQNAPKPVQYLMTGILLAVTIVLGVLVQAEPLLNLSLDPYLDDGIWVTLTALLLSPYAAIKYPREFNFSFLFIFGALAALFVSTGNLLPGFENQTLLDRPLVEMVLYLPLTLLGALGLAGLLEAIRELEVITEKIRSYVGYFAITLFIGLVILIPLRDYNFYPSDCCNFVKYDDTVALDWLNKNTPSDARIWVSSTTMNVLPSGPSTGLVGTDAGIWIPALANRAISFAPFDIDMGSANTLEQLCNEQISYVYVGGTDQKFSIEQLQANAEWYDAVLSLPNAQLYKLTGCSR